MKNKLARVGNFVQNHKVAIIAGTVAVTVIVLQGKHINGLNKFLDEKGLSDEYYGEIN